MPRRARCLLAIDIGNSQTVVGCLVGTRWARDWRLATVPDRTWDETRLLLVGLLASVGVRLADIDGAALSSVVPAATRAIAPLGQEVPLFIVGHDAPFSFAIDVPLPESVGADRLVNAEAAVVLHGTPVIIVDAGTATTFCVVTADRRYVGGAIAPGLPLSAEALFGRASRLAAIDLTPGPQVIGNTTEKALRSGIVLGHAAMIDGMIDRIRREIGERSARVVGTGGAMDLLHPTSRKITVVEPTLTLEGLVLLHDRVERGRVTAPPVESGRRRRLAQVRP